MNRPDLPVTVLCTSVFCRNRVKIKTYPFEPGSEMIERLVVSATEGQKDKRNKKCYCGVLPVMVRSFLILHIKLCLED
jgi:hypothetical protein